MNITVLFFGMLAEETKTSVLELETNALRLNEFKDEILGIFPTLRNMTFKIAVNASIANEDVELTTKTRVAFLPPFAGG